MPFGYPSNFPYFEMLSSVDSNGITAKSAGRMGCHPYDPLTTTNSHQESEDG